MAFCEKFIYWLTNWVNDPSSLLSCGSVLLLTEKVRKRFFFEKKKQKTFVLGAWALKRGKP
jgi:hypothetical protein